MDNNISIDIDLSNTLSLKDFLAEKLPPKVQRARDLINCGDLENLEKYLDSLSDEDLEIICNSMDTGRI